MTKEGRNGERRKEGKQDEECSGTNKRGVPGSGKGLRGVRL